MNELYGGTGLPLLYLDNNPDDHLLVHGATALGRIPLRIRSLTRFSSAVEYLSGDQRFADRRRYPFPVLLLMDYELNGDTGTDLLRWMRIQSQFDGLPVVMFTSWDTPECIAHCYESGADHFLVKPSGFMRMEAVLRALARCFLNHRSDYSLLAQLPEYRPPPVGMNRLPPNHQLLCANPAV